MRLAHLGDGMLLDVGGTLESSNRDACRGSDVFKRACIVAIPVAPVGANWRFTASLERRELSRLRVCLRLRVIANGERETCLL